MQRQWLVLGIIILAYVPVAIDATVLHVAAPSLSVALQATGSELLWIIDIYSLVMAGMVLPMGALGDRIGFRRLMLSGAVIFGLGSLAAAYAPDAGLLIAARALLAVGAAMILPATLAGIRTTFNDAGQRNVALGIWAAIGSGGAAFGPLVGGVVMTHFSWGAVFLINIPIVALVLLLTWRWVPRQAFRSQQKLNLPQAIMLVVAILGLVWAVKSAMKPDIKAMQTLAALVPALLLLVWFVRIQLRSPSPMIDIALFRHRVILTGVVMAVTSMVALVGFELLMAQELQFVHGRTPLQAALFMLPVMLASSCSGPLAGMLVSRLGLRRVATAGMALSGLSFLGLANADFQHQQWLVWSWMVLLGISATVALLSATSAIMSATPKEKAAAAGAIETMAYELGAGLGIALFGLVLARSYSAVIALPLGLTADEQLRAASSIGEAVQVAAGLESGRGLAVMEAASQAFTHSHSVVLFSACVILLALAAVVWFALSAQRCESN
ncbi:SmvA family efflux MFS transporter [Jejubacter calystegiae]|uniref:SmvA family efflux MFS transporter n=1 Tax=Jejubacter calystegiae TaxID=2579935 RepID=A0A4V1G7M5_9ENTR|nr:SmvA family efflux MFS transporter [Jejubacter calystegiae]QCT20167.1 SmvA family efflux MFS transporter [Jejubacter calystegiae]